MSWHDTLFGQIGNQLFESPFSTLWPLLLAPLAAALVSDMGARRLPRTPAAWPWAALLAAAPGYAALAVISMAEQYDRIETWRGVVHSVVTPAIGLGFLVYALVRAVRRQAEVGRLFRLAHAPGERLRRAAERLGLRALEIPSADKDCFVAGVIRPTVFVSTGALKGLNDQELEAALWHERTHVAAHDTRALMLLAVLRDLAPWGRAVALEAFRSAREAAADGAAAHAAGSLNLASALVALARSGGRPAPAAALAMARPDNLSWRMRALLQEEPCAPLANLAWLQVGGALMLSGVLVAWPLFHSKLTQVFCIYY